VRRLQERGEISEQFNPERLGIVNISMKFKDTGAGISAEGLKNLFINFSRL
jgi:hypothetical protein